MECIRAHKVPKAKKTSNPTLQTNNIHQISEGLFQISPKFLPIDHRWKIMYLEKPFFFLKLSFLKKWHTTCKQKE